MTGSCPGEQIYALDGCRPPRADAEQFSASLVPNRVICEIAGLLRGSCQAQFAFGAMRQRCLGPPTACPASAPAGLQRRAAALTPANGDPWALSLPARLCKKVRCRQQATGTPWRWRAFITKSSPVTPSRGMTSWLPLLQAIADGDRFAG